MDYQEPTPAPRESNTLGLVGFILSLTCCLSPVALILCIIAVMKPPRGFAVAGLVISILITGAVGTSWWKLDQSARQSGINAVEAFAYLGAQAQLSQALNVHMTNAEKTIPKTIDELGADPEFLTDPWGHAYKLGEAEFRDDAFDPFTKHQGKTIVMALRSAGPDGVWDNADDLPKGRFGEDAATFMTLPLGWLSAPVRD